MSDNLVVETRPCRFCKFFQVVAFPPPICKKYLMTVYADMYVTYEKDQGTCFEPIRERVIVAEGELYEKLEALSGGKFSIVRLPLYRPLGTDVFSGEANPLRPISEYEEWEIVYQTDGSHAWARCGNRPEKKP